MFKKEFEHVSTQSLFHLRLNQTCEDGTPECDTVFGLIQQDEIRL